MTKQLWRAGLALAVATAMTACANQDRTDGGGGGTAGQSQGAGQARDVMAVDEQRGYEDRAPMGEKISANVTTDLSGRAREYAEAYARAPWVHANLAAGDWERADDDLQFISTQVANIQKDSKLDGAIRAKLDVIKPMIAQLDGQIGAKNPQALHNASLLVTRMAQLVGDRQMLAWFGGHLGGGGAGTGIVGPKRVGDKVVGDKKVGPKIMGDRE